MLRQPLLDPRRQSINGGEHVVTIQPKNKVSEKTKEKTAESKLAELPEPINKLAELPEAIMHHILDFCETGAGYELLKGWVLKNWGRNWAMVLGQMEKYSGEKFPKFRESAICLSLAPLLLEKMDRDIQSTSIEKARELTIRSPSNWLALCAGLCAAGPAAFGCYCVSVLLPENGYEIDTFTRNGDLSYRKVQKERPDIFSFENNETFQNCTIIQNLPCDSNCTESIKSCDVYDPYFLNCGNHEGGYLSFQRVTPFSSTWAQTLHDYNPVPYTTPLDERLLNASEATEEAIEDVLIFIALCEAVRLKAIDRDSKEGLLIMACFVFLICLLGIAGVKKGVSCCYRYKGEQQVRESTFSTWLEQVEEKAQYQKLIKWMGPDAHKGTVSETRNKLGLLISRMKTGGLEQGFAGNRCHFFRKPVDKTVSKAPVSAVAPPKVTVSPSGV